MYALVGDSGPRSTVRIYNRTLGPFLQKPAAPANRIKSLLKRWTCRHFFPVPNTAEVMETPISDSANIPQRRQR